MRRRLCLLLAFLLTRSGCSGPQRSGEEASDRLTVTYPTLSGIRLDGLPRIQSAVNAISREEAGVEVEFLTEDS